VVESASQTTTSECRIEVEFANKKPIPSWKAELAQAIGHTRLDT